MYPQDVQNCRFIDIEGCISKQDFMNRGSQPSSIYGFTTSLIFTVIFLAWSKFESSLVVMHPVNTLRFDIPRCQTESQFMLRDNGVLYELA